MSNLTPERLAEIEARASRLRDDVIGALKGTRLRASIPRRDDDTDALAVTLAETDIPDLLAEVRRLRERQENTAKRSLWRLMGDLSEWQWCAGWYSGLEYILWEAITDPTSRFADPRQYPAIAADAAELRELAEDAGGWWAWPSSEEDGQFVPLAEWRDRFAEWREALKR